MKFTRIKQLFPTSDPPRFNFGAWSDNSITYLLGRQLNSKSSSYFHPDVSSLLFAKLKNHKIIQKQIVWEPAGEELLEDPRALIKGKAKVLLGLTAVLKENHKWVTYPAVTTFNYKALKFGDVDVVQNFGHGKNTTPIKKNVFLFRPANIKFFYKFLVFEYKKHKAKYIQELDIPRVEWGMWKIGAASPPIWISKKLALMFIAGLNLVDGKYVYTIGKAFLELKGGKFVIKSIDSKPIITRKTFDGFGIRELHPEDREVVYMCGSVLNKNGNLDMYVNVGDRNTFIVSARLQDFL